jgi:mannan endo-1,4-beta-mannosidase
VIGEFGHLHSDGDPDEEAILRLARKYGIGYLGWAWSGNCCGGEYLDMVTNFDPALLTPWGQRIFDGANGIARTALEASIYSGERNPEVVSVRRVNPNPTSLPSVKFRVTFSEPVTGVDATAPFRDLRLVTTGVTGAAITSVSGSGATYTVTVNTGSGSGAIRLDVLDNDTVVDAKKNSLGGPGPGYGNYRSGQTYTVTKP